MAEKKYFVQYYAISMGVSFYPHTPAGLKMIMVLISILIVLVIFIHVFFSLLMACVSHTQKLSVISLAVLPAHYALVLDDFESIMSETKRCRRRLFLSSR